MRTIDHTGQRFGKLVVTERCGSVGAGKAAWACRCDCGKTTVVSGDHLRCGKTKSCGCRIAERNAEVRGTHLHARKGLKSPEYGIWESIKKRCLNPRDQAYSRYGGRGIRICDRWRDDFQAFLSDVGVRPTPEHSIDRIDNDGNYEPGNVRWATKSEQARNRNDEHILTQSPAPSLDERVRRRAGYRLRNAVKSGWITRPKGKVFHHLDLTRAYYGAWVTPEEHTKLLRGQQIAVEPVDYTDQVEALRAQAIKNGRRNGALAATKARMARKAKGKPE